MQNRFWCFQLISPFFPTTNARVESPPEFWALALEASRGFVWRIVGLDASYVLHIDLLAVLCWTGAVWTEQRSCLNDLAALCTIIHLTGGSQCPAEGLHLLWPLALHSDKGTSIEYFWDPQHMYIDVQYVAAYWFWTSLFHCEKETLCYDNMWISRVTFKWSVLSSPYVAVLLWDRCCHISQHTCHIS